MPTHSAASDTVDVAVVGGGLVGWAAAHRLATAGVPTTVIDRGDPGHATQAGAGIIAPGVGADAAEAQARFPLARAAVAYYGHLIPELANAGAPDPAYAKPGLLFVSRNEEEAERLPGLAGVLDARRARGMGNIGLVSHLSGTQARALFPPLADLPGALHLADGARVDGRLLRSALRHAAGAAGARLVQGSATLIRVGDRVERVEVAGGPVLTVGHVLLAGGAWSPALTAQLGIELPIHPQRGQIVHLDMHGEPTDAWPIVEGWFDHYLLAFPRSRVVAGASREHESGFAPHLTAGGQRSVLTNALALAPGLAEGIVAEWRVGLRPFSADGQPVLGLVPGVANVSLCTGHGPGGLTLGPVSAALVAATLGAPDATALGLPDVELTSYDPARLTGAHLGAG